ncbi:hypothetical protein NL676_001398 [Syzygium grande]|nr:hypothetical protein NL676_001398 [Syzygium grande]
MRKWLFSFAGGPCSGSPRSIRAWIIDQCNGLQHCRLMQCSIGLSNLICHSPSSVTRALQGLRLCLHPQGDSYTRRSAFNSILAGCIPVFFHPGSAHTQYTWHLPKEHAKYSVFIPEDNIRKKNASTEDRLGLIPHKKVQPMREEVISLIPRIVYTDPRAKLESV